jgi:hypothetical protein
MAAHSFDALRFVGGAAFLATLPAAEVPALARWSLGMHGATNNVALVFVGLASTLYALLWLRSRFVPRGIALLGIVASSLLAIGTMVWVVAPSQWRIIYPAYMVPMFFFEVGIAGWLLARGPRAPPSPAVSGT